jgi:DNA-binding NarL/FixJ family response regulator
MMIKLILADDHPLVREGIEKVLKTEDLQFELISVSNSEELMSQLERELPDLLILDIAMPGKSGLDILKEVHQKYEKLPVLMLSMHPEERFAVRTIKSGAYGYVNKRSVTEELVQAIKTIVEKKKRYISESVAEQLALDINSDHLDAPHEKLSDREFQVMRNIAAGKKAKEIAEELNLSVRTIHTYRLRMMEKMNLKSDVAITRYAMAHHLIDDEP